MPDNLTVQISANADKLRAELGKAQAAVRDLSKEFRAASDQARKTGDSTNLNRVSAQLNAATREVRGFTRALATQNAALDAAAAGTSRFGTALATLDTRLGSIIGLSGGLKTFIAGFTLLEGVQATLGKVSDTLKQFRETAGVTLGTGLKPETVKAFNLAMTRAGLAGEKTSGSLIQFTGAAGDALAKWKELNKEALTSSGQFKMVGDAVNTAGQNMSLARGSVGQLGGALVKVVRGAEKLDENRDVFASIGVDISKFVDATGRLDLDKLLEASAKALDLKRALQPATAARGGALLFGEDDITRQAKAIKDLGQNFADLTNQAKNLPPTAQDNARLEEYDNAVAQLNTTWNRLWGNVASGSLDMDTALARGADRALTGFESLGTKANEYAATLRTVVGGAYDWLVQKAGEWLAADQAGADTRKQMWTDLETWIVDTWTSTFQTLYDKASAFFSWLSDKLNAAWSRLGSLPDSAPLAGGSTVGGMASGGMVRGPGSGTSDSIMARLSNGEFVMRAAAVAHWGPQLLASMNALNGPLKGLSGGGNGYADGGVVRATTVDGAVVNLHFPGGSFSLRGDKSIVQGLTREARRASLLAGGRLPGAAVA